jgi:hypothetical protein
MRRWQRAEIRPTPAFIAACGGADSSRGRPSLPGRSSRRCRHWSDPELVQHAKLVELGPRLHDPAADDPINADARDNHALAGWR